MNLNTKHLTTLLRRDYIVIGVRFTEGDDRYGRTCSDLKTYHYKYKGPTPAIGDKVLVLAPGGYKVVTVVSVNDGLNTEASFSYKWAVGSIMPLIAEHQTHIDTDERIKSLVEKVRVAAERRALTMALSDLIKDMSSTDADELQRLLNLNTES
jgi:hypothetical protein